jgi:hypothetical protein
MHRAFGTGVAESSVQRWNWLFGAEGGPDPAHYLLADAGHDLAGQYALLPLRMQHDGRQIMGLLSLDTATDPRFERQGIFTTLARQLYDEASEQMPLIIGFPNPKSAPVLYQKLDWVEVRPYPLLIRPLTDLAPILGAWKQSLAGIGRVLNVATPLLRLASHTELALSQTTGATVARFQRFGPWADDLWSCLAPGFRSATIRDAAFLNWRFCDSPRQYELYGLERRGEFVGFAVSRLRASHVGSVADLMELMVRPDDAAGARALLSRVIIDSAANGAIALHALISTNHPHRRQMYRLGLLPVPAPLASKHSFGVRINGRRAKPNAALHADDWYLTASDIDFY